MENTNAVVKLTENFSLAYVKDIQEKIMELYKSIMKQDIHYGIIPGCQKPSLLKAGAEKIINAFHLVPVFEETEKFTDDKHLIVSVKCIIKNRNGEILGEGLGCCTTMESKYMYKTIKPICKTCGKELYFDKQKKQYYCWKKAGGCGFVYLDLKAEKILTNPADNYNTVKKMAKKRALVDAVLTITAVSDLFTQDIEDLQDTEYFSQETIELVNNNINIQNFEQKLNLLKLKLSKKIGENNAIEKIRNIVQAYNKEIADLTKEEQENIINQIENLIKE